jgi:hypothetical protein
MLLRRYAYLELGEGATVFVLHEDGAVSTTDGQERIPAASTHMVVSTTITEEYIPLLTEMTWNLGKALQQERERTATAGVVHAQAFLRWMQTALRVQPDLMRGFRASASQDGERCVILIPTGSSLNVDYLAPWKTA